MNFKELLGKQMLFFDGATGTQLQARGLQPGELPESWNFTHPDIVEAVPPSPEPSSVRPSASDRCV